MIETAKNINIDLPHTILLWFLVVTHTVEPKKIKIKPETNEIAADINKLLGSSRCRGDRFNLFTFFLYSIKHDKVKMGFFPSNEIFWVISNPNRKECNRINKKEPPLFHKKMTKEK